MTTRTIALLLMLLVGCAQPLPPDRAAYAGEWRGTGVRLLITPDGMLHYERRQDGGSITLNVPIQRFDGDDFEAGIGPAVTRFDVTQPPTQVDGMWTMTVDGRVLERISEGVDSARHPHDPPSISA